MTHPITDAWNEFVRENPDTFDVTGLGATHSHTQYLANRLDRAFKAGVEAGEAIERKRIIQHIQTLIAP